MKNKIVLSSIAVVAAGALGACGASSPNSSATSDGPIKIALVTPSSGPLALYGEGSTRAWQYAVDEVNADGGIDGRTVELVIKDTDGQAATTVRAAQEAVTKDGAQFISGVMTSPENLAIYQKAQQMGVLALNTIGQDDSLAGASCSPNGFNIVQPTKMSVAALSKAFGSIPGKKWAIIAADYNVGHNSADSFTAAAKANGDEVVSTQFAPLGTTDFGSYITQIKRSGADAVFTSVYGADAVAFINQADQFHMSDTVETVVGLNSVTEPLFPVLKDKVLGYYGNLVYDIAADNPLNTSFAAGYEKEYGETPYFTPANAYAASEVLFAGIEKASSTDADEVREALEGATLDTIHGEVTMRAEDHQLLSPVYIAEVVKDGSGLKWEVLEPVPASETNPEPSPDCKL